MKRLLLLLWLPLAVVGYAQSAHNTRTTPAPATRQAVEPTRLLLILDCSSSMWDRWQSDSKIKVTQTVLLKFLDSIANQSHMEVALRVFGHLNKEAYGTRLEVPFEPHNIYKIQSKIKTLVPKGGCTIDKALTNSLKDFPAATGSRNIILIITDGIDDCAGNICHVAQQVQRSGMVVQTFVLGIGNNNDFDNRIHCAGRFTRVSSEEHFAQTLYNIISLSGEQARVLVRVTDEEDHLYETATPLALYDAQSGVPRILTHYGINGNYRADTLTVDPLTTYNIVLFTKPETVIPNRQFATGVLNRLDIIVNQGMLRLRHEAKRTTLPIPNYPVLVYLHGSNQVLHTIRMGEQHPFLSGNYDIEILSTPTMRLDNVAVQPSAHTDLTIPLPGMANIAKPRGVLCGDIFCEEQGTLRHVCQLDGSKSNEQILLLPGNYQVILYPQDNAHYAQVRTKHFTIEAGQQTAINP